MRGSSRALAFLRRVVGWQTSASSIARRGVNRPHLSRFGGSCSSDGGTKTPTATGRFSNRRPGCHTTTFVRRSRRLQRAAIRSSPGSAVRLASCRTSTRFSCSGAKFARTTWTRFTKPHVLSLLKQIRASSSHTRTAGARHFLEKQRVYSYDLRQGL